MSMKRDLPIYVLSASLVYFGLSISTSQATAAPAQVSVSDFNRLKSDFESFKRCANQNFLTIGFYDASRTARMGIVRSCY